MKAANKAFSLLVCVATAAILFVVHHHFLYVIVGRWRRVGDVWSSADEGSTLLLSSLPDATLSPISYFRYHSVVVSPPPNPGCLSKKLGDYKPIYTGKVYYHPPIVHYAKLSRSTQPVILNFRDFMALMSVYKFLRPEKILIHTYGNIIGKYWYKAKRWKKVAVKIIKHSRLKNIGGKMVRYVAHEADYIRLEALLKFGGLISDFDVVVVNGTKLRKMQQLSECVISKEETFLNVGFVSCIKNSTYISRWLDSYSTDFNPLSYLYNSGYKPKYLLENESNKDCCNCLVEDTICFDPGNGPDDKIRWLKRNGVQWRNKTAAHYFVKSGFKFDDQRLVNASHSLGEMFRYIFNSPI